MKKLKIKNILSILLMLLFIQINTGLGFSEPTEKPSFKSSVKRSIDFGIDFLRKKQKDGKWLNHPGVTSLCLLGMINSHRNYNRLDGPFMRLPLEYLVKSQQKDGAIYDPNSRAPTKNYCTSLAILTLAATKDPIYLPVIEKAKNFLVEIQADEGEGYDKDKDYFYGGIGYGGDQRPDLSNLHLALEALSDAGLKKDHPLYKKALIFVERCQDTEKNKLEWSEASGGFAYSPDLPTNRNLPTKKGSEKTIIPYGSMTYAGLKSLIFCNVDANDPSIKQALNWVKKNFSVKIHPGMKDSQTSIYYYYFTLAKTLDLLEESNFKVSDTLKLNWRKELGQELLARQKKDGSWVNSQKKYMEGVPELCTAYALNALDLVYKKL